MKTTTLSGSIALLFFLLSYDVHGETQVFQDASFPYRISCRPEWAEEIKNDSVFQLRSTIAGRKTRFQLKRYLLDSTYTKELMRWSRLTFFLNKQFAEKWGAVLSFDTSTTKKIGDLRAFELRARCIQTVEGQEVWWTEYTRWTEDKGYGYLAMVFGDTADMRINFSTYKILLDSVFIKYEATTVLYHQVAQFHSVQPEFSATSVPFHDLLGRKLNAIRPGCSVFLLQNRMKRPILQEPHTR